MSVFLKSKKEFQKFNRLSMNLLLVGGLSVSCYSFETFAEDFKNSQICAGEVAPPSKLTIPVGKSTLINLPEALGNRTVGNDGVLETRLMSTTSLYVVGVDVGTSNMILQTKTGKCSIVDVFVTMDPDPLQQMLHDLMPDEQNIKVSAAADSLVLSGFVENPLSVNRAVELAGAYVRRMVQRVPGKDGQQNQSQQNQQSMMQSQQGGQVVPGFTPRIVNMLSVNAQQQVMLEVKVAEVSKTLLDKLGSQFSLTTTTGSWTYGVVSSLLSLSGSSTGGTVAGVKTDGKRLGFDGQKNDGLIKILAEPSIMAISGQEGSFLAGGTIFIPVAQQGVGAGAIVTLQEKQFGVGVKFTPTVLGGGKINLQVAPEVSELNREGVGISATGISATAILPAFTVRKASTTVQLMDGQTFAIGGLIKNNTTTNIKAFPFLGEIPVLGVLFRSSEFQKDRTELVFMVTPHLVKPLNPAEAKLPTDNYKDPTRAELYLKGKTEGEHKENQQPATTTQPAPEAATNSTGFDK